MTGIQEQRNELLPLYSMVTLVSVSVVLSIVRLIGHLLFVARSRPEPRAILAAAPARCFLRGKQICPVNSAVCALINQQLASGRQLGIQVAAFHHGQPIISVCGGLIRKRGRIGWMPVTPSTLFMAYSVSKGISAMAVAVLVDQGVLDWSDPVSKYWKAFKKRGKRHVTVACALSHRAGLTKTGPIFLAKCFWAYMREGWKSSWEVGLRHIESYRPDWKPGTRCEYHPLSWSWIIGGVVDHSTNHKKHISNVVQQSIADVLETTGEMFIGRLPPAQHDAVCLLEYSTNYGNTWWQCIAAFLESVIFRTIGNSHAWKEVCLPSSNGFFTARAVAKAYGALANKGSVDGCRLLSSRTTSHLIASACSSSELLESSADSMKLAARMTLGFDPWPAPDLHGKNASDCIGHSGMGGFHAYADPVNGLSICVFGNVYEPIAAQGSSISQDTKDICRIIRESLQIS